ncbi:MAG: FAD:protein FMN transferase, partial [Nitrospira sp.]|nr:FAD:protein FMN transferase [Nitrospira sp.]
MGTTYNVKYRPTQGTPSLTAMQIEVDTLLAEINHTMSTYDPESELSRLNRLRTTDWVSTSASLLAVLKAALEIASARLLARGTWPAGAAARVAAARELQAPDGLPVWLASAWAELPPVWDEALAWRRDPAHAVVTQPLTAVWHACVR